MAASDEQHRIGREWAKKIRKLAPGSRDAWARFDVEEQRRDDEHEQKGGNA